MSTSPSAGTALDVRPKTALSWKLLTIVLLFAAAVYFGCIVSPPSLMDDVDAVQAQIARNMLHSGDWVTARLDGVPYLEKPPLLYWLIAVAYKALGERDWVARIPEVLSAIAVCWVSAASGAWAFGRRAGFYAGLCMATCTGLWLFTRILLPDALMTFTIALALWGLLRALDEDKPHPGRWAATVWVCFGLGLLLKSLIGIVFPLGAAAVYLLLTKQLFVARTWRRLRPVSGIALMLLVAAPWHVWAMLRNPPAFAFTMRSLPGEYHGFFWFFFINEQLLRFLNLRYPRDYATVPRVYFWLFNLIWLFPWSVYLPASFQLRYRVGPGETVSRPERRARQMRLLALCWIGFVMVFFTFSTTQEYYSMPIYPAMALLIGSAMTLDNRAVRIGTRVLTVLCTLIGGTLLAILIAVRHVPAAGDISQALLVQQTYRLSLSHMQDLTLDAFAYLRWPLGLAVLAFAMGVIATFKTRWRGAYVGIALMMVVFFQAARLAMVVFDPYLSSRVLVQAVQHDPPGEIIVDHHYYWYSSVFFYTGRPALILNGRFQNLVYGSYAPGAADPFLSDGQLAALWKQPRRYYLFTKDAQAERFRALLGSVGVIKVATSGGKLVLTNQPFQ